MTKVCLSYTKLPRQLFPEVSAWLLDNLDADFTLRHTIITTCNHEFERVRIRIMKPSIFYGLMLDFANEDDAALFKLTWGEYCWENRVVKESW